MCAICYQDASRVYGMALPLLPGQEEDRSAKHSELSVAAGGGRLVHGRRRRRLCRNHFSDAQFQR